MELQRSLKELEDKEIELRTSRKSLRGKKLQLQNIKEDLFESEKSRRKLHSSMSHLKEGIDDSSMVNTSRELLLKRILDAELDVGTVNHQMDLLRDSLRLLIRVCFCNIVRLVLLFLVTSAAIIYSTIHVP